MRTSFTVLATGVTTAATIALVTGCASASHQGDSVASAAASSAVPSTVATAPATSPSTSPAATSVPESAMSSAPASASPAETPLASPSIPTPSPTTSGSTKATGVVHNVDDTANGSTVRVHVGDTVRVTLHSTYWQMDPPSTSALRAGDSAVAASPPGPGHVPGSGAGTVVTSYVIVHAGTAKITAQRTSCGEALLCPPNMRSYVVTLAVAAS